MKIKTQLLPLALLALGQATLAQQIPGAGTQLQQLPPPPVRDKAAPMIRIEESTSPGAPGAALTSVRVNALEFTGTRVYSSAQLLAIANFTPGSDLTLRELQAIAARVTEYYRRHGYFVARAYLPAQDISDHVVSIAVSEGKYGKISVRNQSNLSDGLASDLLDGLNSGDAITLQPLEHRLLMLSDVPGVNVTSTLVPGTAPGTSDLIVDVAPGRRITGLVDADNAGNPYTGEYRLGALVNVNNVLGRGDVASLRVISSGEGLNYGRASYQAWFGRATAGVAFSHLEYELGKQFAPLGAHGTADIASLFGAMPLWRSRASNLYFGLALEDRHFDDRIDLMPLGNREAQISAGVASLYGDHQDDFGGGGATSFYVSVTAGSLDIQTPAALALDAITAHSNGSYGKLWFNLARQQHVTDTLSLHASLTGQIASKNLDPSEKFVLGGMDGLRGYPQGEAFGDEGVLLDVEARLLLDNVSAHVPGNVYLLGFVDAGRVTINKHQWAPGDNERSLSGAGVGALWNDPGNFSVRMYYASRLGSEEAISAPDKSGRFWIQMVKYF